MNVHARITVVPSRILGLIRILSASKSGHPRDEVTALMQPEPLLREGRKKGSAADDDEQENKKKPDLANEAISAALDLGLVEAYRDGHERDSLRVPETLHRSLRVNGTFSDDECWQLLAAAALQDGAQDNAFAEFCSWLQFHTASRMPADEGTIRKALEDDGLELDRLQMRNKAALQNAFYWSHYLGLSWHRRPGRVSDGVIPDPSAYLRRRIDEVLPLRLGEIHVRDLRTRIGAVCPALDGGVHHQRVARRLAERNRPNALAPDRLTPGLSFALRHLRDTRVIDYSCPDDQRDFLLMTRDEKIALIRRAEVALEHGQNIPAPGLLERPLPRRGYEHDRARRASVGLPRDAPPEPAPTAGGRRGAFRCPHRG
jgi:hypothetical protein